jgi:3,4-dihydroxy 2-butanone 4-phosphate synthase/GTP cyclohydrolase II
MRQLGMLGRGRTAGLQRQGVPAACGGASSRAKSGACMPALLRGATGAAPAPQHAGRRQLLAPPGGQVNSSLSLPLDRPLDSPLDGFDSIADALADLAAGKFVVVLDDEDRENEGDLIIAADKATTEAMAFLVEYSSGVVCISMEGRDLERLRLPLMVSSAENEEAMSTAFTVTVDLKAGVSTGISAADRAKTIVRMADAASRPEEFNRPGHIFPLRCRSGGVLVRPGHTEAAVDLARLAGCYPAGVLCEIVNKRDGSMARTPDLLAFSKEHGLKCITIADLVRYRLAHEQLVEQTASAELDTRHGRMAVHTFRSAVDGRELVAMVAGAGTVAQREGVAVHIVPESSVADVVGAAAGPGPSSLDAALQHIAAEGCGVVVYVRGQQQEGGAAAELRALAASSSGAAGGAAGGEAQQMDLRDLGVAAQVLKSLSPASVAVMGDARAVKVLGYSGLPATLHPGPGRPQHTSNGGGVREAAHSLH